MEGIHGTPELLSLVVITIAQLEEVMLPAGMHQSGLMHYARHQNVI